MTKTRFTQWIVLVCMGALAACTSGEGDTVGNTELNVVVPNGAPSLGGGSSAPDLIDIQSVEYTINCLGNDDTFLENGASFADEVRLEGNLEVLDGRTNPQGAIPPEFGTPRPGDGAEVWQGFMDLPPGDCTVELRARDNDGEVICTAQEPFVITADTTSKVNLVLVCDVSFQAPVGMLDVDATFSFVVSNFCPDLFVLNCLDSAPQEQVVAPPPIPPVATTLCEVRFRDGDSQCGESCDPQTCVVTPEGLDCTPGPDPGVSTTVTCVDNFGAGQIDCDFNALTTETSCVFNGDTLGATPVAGPIVPNAPGAGAFVAACTPPALGGTPGATLTCTAVTTDGDEDCDKVKTVDIACPGLTQCATFGDANGEAASDAGGDAACAATASSQICLDSTCNNATCDGSDRSLCCDDVAVNDGGDCSSENPPLAVCNAGVCETDACTVDADCDDGNECTTDTCDVGTGVCTNDGAPNDGNACQPDASCGATDGTCGGGTCTANDACSVAGDCPNTPAAPADPQCTAAVCTSDVCGNFCDIDLAANAGSVCDFNPSAADGVCQANGECVFAPPSCNFDNNGSDSTPTSGIVSVACTNSVTTAQSPFPFTLIVDVPGSVVGGGSFNASFDGIGVFPEFFLDAAQGVVPGGVSVAELVDIVSTVQVRSGATGPDVPLGADTTALTPGAVRFCNFPTDQVCTCPGGTLPGDTCAEPACVGGTCNAEQVLAALPTSTDCAGGGTCDGLGKTGTGSQCDLNGFCITGDLIIEFEESAPTAYTADPSGTVLFGWADQGVPGLVLCPAAAPNCQDAFMPDGCYDLPAAVFSNPTAPIGIRVNASGLFVPIQCAMAEAGGICASGEGCLADGDCATPPCTPTTDVACPTPDSSLLTCNIF